MYDGSVFGLLVGTTLGDTEVMMYHKEGSYGGSVGGLNIFVVAVVFEL